LYIVILYTAFYERINDDDDDDDDDEMENTVIAVSRLYINYSLTM